MQRLTRCFDAGREMSRAVMRAIRPKILGLGLIAMAMLPGCVFSNHRDAGIGLGGGLGALTGALIGQQSGHELGGAVIGAVAGVVIGGLIGEGQDQREREEAERTYAQYRASTGQVLTNTDIIRMTQCGLSDPVIINMIWHTPGKYDLSPNGVIQLKSFGTSDQVILTLQQVPTIPAVSTAGYARSSPRVDVGLVVAPAPVVMYRSPRRYDYGGPNYYRRHW